VRVIFLETRETMPAHTWECDEALAEGVMLVPASATVSFEVQAGRVLSALCQRVQRLEIDEKKRIRPVLGGTIPPRQRRFDGGRPSPTTASSPRRRRARRRGRVRSSFVTPRN
jgi:hypothetical protein